MVINREAIGLYPVKSISTTAWYTADLYLAFRPFLFENTKYINKLHIRKTIHKKKVFKLFTVTENRYTLLERLDDKTYTCWGKERCKCRPIVKELKEKDMVDYLQQLYDIVKEK